MYLIHFKIHKSPHIDRAVTLKMNTPRGEENRIQAPTLQELTALLRQQRDDAKKESMKRKEVKHI
jgi:hypothetical protein